MEEWTRNDAMRRLASPNTAHQLTICLRCRAVVSLPVKRGLLGDRVPMEAAAEYRHTLDERFCRHGNKGGSIGYGATGHSS